MKTLLQHFGLLRTGLAALALILIVVAPEPRAPTVLEWPEIVPSLIAPATAPLVMMALLLDLLMARLFSADADDDERKRLKHIMWLNAGLIASLVVRWLPFFMALGRPL